MSDGSGGGDSAADVDAVVAYSLCFVGFIK